MDNLNKTFFVAQSHSDHSKREFFFLEEVQFIQIDKYLTNVYFYNSRVLGITLESGNQLIAAIRDRSSNIESEKPLYWHPIQSG